MKISLHKICRLSANLPGTQEMYGIPPYVPWDKLVEFLKAYGKKKFVEPVNRLRSAGSESNVGARGLWLQQDINDVMRVMYYPEADEPGITIEISAWVDQRTLYSPKVCGAFDPEEEGWANKVAAQLESVGEDLRRHFGPNTWVDNPKVSGKLSTNNWTAVVTVNFPARVTISEDDAIRAGLDEDDYEFFEITDRKHNYEGPDRHKYENTPGGVYDYLKSEGLNPPDPDEDRNAYLRERNHPEGDGVWSVDFSLVPEGGEFFNDTLEVRLKGYREGPAGLGGGIREFNDYEIIRGD